MRLLARYPDIPQAARATGNGETLLVWLPPHDESKGLELAQLLLDHDADATVRDPRDDRRRSRRTERDVRSRGTPAGA